MKPASDQKTEHKNGESIYIVGHRRPDTDSGASAVALGYLLTQLNPDNQYLPVCLDPPNEQTRKLFEVAGLALPVVLDDLRPRVKDVMRKGIELQGQLSLREALETLQSVPDDIALVVDNERHLCGILSDRISEPQFFFLGNVEDFLGSVLKVEDLVRGAPLEQLAGTPKPGVGEQLRLRVPSSTGDPVKKSDVVVTVGDMETLKLCQQVGVAAAILVDIERQEALRRLSCWSGPPVYYFPGSIFAFASRLGLCFPVEVAMSREWSSLDSEMLLDDAARVLSAPPHAAPVLNDEGQPVGVVSASDLINVPPRPLILVDHFEKDQSLPGLDSFDIREIVDHHRVGNMETLQPIRVDCRPWGSTASVIAARFREEQVEMTAEIATILLGALISDTLLLTSPTTTATDRTCANKLAECSGVELQKFGKEVLSWNDIISSGDPAVLVSHDCKRFSHEGVAFLVSQLETVDLSEVDVNRLELLRQAMGKACQREDAAFGILMVTGVLEQSSRIMFYSLGKEGWWSEEKDREEKGWVSRKKQLLPWILENFKSNPL